MSKETGSERKVTIVGAGFSGLVVAYYLLKENYSVEIFEAQDRVGGLINTIETDWGLVETAANGLLNSGEVEALFKEVGIELLPTKKDAKKRYVYRDGRPRRWPLGFSATLCMIGFVLKAIFAPKKVVPLSQENVRAWGARVMGAEASAYTVETFLQGVYAGDSSRMSASTIFGRFFKRGVKKKSAAKPSRHGTVSARGGMNEVISKLRSYLEERGVKIHLGANVLLEPELSAPVVLATSADRAGEALIKIDPERATALKRVEMLPLITTTVFYREPISHHGFGCLFPPSENRRVLGVLMNTFIFENRVRNAYSETWVMGGALGQETIPGFITKSDEEILSIIDSERASAFGAKSERLGYRITRWPKGLPHYTVELERDLELIRTSRKNVFLAGNYLGQIGLAKVLERAAEIPGEIAQSAKWS